MEAHLALAQPTQVSKITTSCEICSGLHDTQYCMEDPEQAFVEYASSRTDEVGGKWYTFQPEQNNLGDTYNLSINTITIHPTQQSDSHNRTEENEEEERGSPKNHPDSPTPPAPSISFITEKVLKFNSLFESLRLVPPLPNAKLVCIKVGYGNVMFIEIIPKDDNSHKEETKPGIQEVEYFNIFSTKSELAYHKYLMCGPIPSIFLRNPVIIEGNPLNLKILCNFGKLNPREDTNGGVSNFTGRIKGMHVFIGNFTYIIDFMIIKDISSIIDPRLSPVVLGRPFVEMSNMTHPKVIFDEKKLGSS
ncbi:hypothetical protein Tco_1531146 [Tanacetum coccineum]